MWAVAKLTSSPVWKFRTSGKFGKKFIKKIKIPKINKQNKIIATIRVKTGAKLILAMAFFNSANQGTENNNDFLGLGDFRATSPIATQSLFDVDGFSSEFDQEFKSEKPSLTPSQITNMLSEIEHYDQSNTLKWLNDYFDFELNFDVAGASATGELVGTVCIYEKHVWMLFCSYLNLDGLTFKDFLEVFGYENYKKAKDLLSDLNTVSLVNKDVSKIYRKRVWYDLLPKTPVRDLMDVGPLSQIIPTKEECGFDFRLGDFKNFKLTYDEARTILNQIQHSKTNLVKYKKQCEEIVLEYLRVCPISGAPKPEESKKIAWKNKVSTGVRIPEFEGLSAQQVLYGKDYGSKYEAKPEILSRCQTPIEQEVEVFDPRTKFKKLDTEVRSSLINLHNRNIQVLSWDTFEVQKIDFYGITTDDTTYINSIFGVNILGDGRQLVNLPSGLVHALSAYWNLLEEGLDLEKYKMSQTLCNTYIKELILTDEEIYDCLQYGPAIAYLFDLTKRQQIRRLISRDYKHPVQVYTSAVSSVVAAGSLVASSLAAARGAAAIAATLAVCGGVLMAGAASLFKLPNKVSRAHIVAISLGGRVANKPKIDRDEDSKLVEKYVNPIKIRDNTKIEAHAGGIYNSNYKPVVFSSNVENDIAALEKRVLCVKNPVDEAEIQIWKMWVLNNLSLLFPKRFGPILAKTFEKWIEECNSTPSQKARYRRAVAELFLKGYDEQHIPEKRVLEKYAIHESFMKKELTLTANVNGDNNKMPRLIQGCSPEKTVVTGPWFSALNGYLSDAWDVDFIILYASGKNSTLVANFLADSPDYYLKGYDDISAMDASVSKPLLKAEMEIFRALGCPEYCAKSTEAGFQKRGITVNGLYYETEGTRGSGGAETSAANTILNALQHLYIFQKRSGYELSEIIKRRLYKAAVIGDDNAYVHTPYNSNGERFNIDWHGDMIKFGFATTPNYCSEFYQMEFCSSIMLPSTLGWCFVPKIGRFISKGAWSLTARDTEQAVAFYVDNCRSLLAVSNCCPPFKALLEAGLEIGSKQVSQRHQKMISKLKRYEPWRMELKYSGEPVSKTWEALKYLYNWDQDSQALWEENLAKINFLPHNLNWGFSDLFCDRDTDGPQKYFNQCLSKYYYDYDEYIKDLTNEGIEPNPGPAYERLARIWSHVTAPTPNTNQNDVPGSYQPVDETVNQIQERVFGAADFISGVPSRVYNRLNKIINQLAPPPSAVEVEAQEAARQEVIQIVAEELKKTYVPQYHDLGSNFTVTAKDRNPHRFAVGDTNAVFIHTPAMRNDTVIMTSKNAALISFGGKGVKKGIIMANPPSNLIFSMNDKGKEVFILGQHLESQPEVRPYNFSFQPLHGQFIILISDKDVKGKDVDTTGFQLDYIVNGKPIRVGELDLRKILLREGVEPNPGPPFQETFNGSFTGGSYIIFVSNEYPVDILNIEDGLPLGISFSPDPNGSIAISCDYRINNTGSCSISLFFDKPSAVMISVDSDMVPVCIDLTPDVETTKLFLQGASQGHIIDKVKYLNDFYCLDCPDVSKAITVHDKGYLIDLDQFRLSTDLVKNGFINKLKQISTTSTVGWSAPGTEKVLQDADGEVIDANSFNLNRSLVNRTAYCKNGNKVFAIIVCLYFLAILLTCSFVGVLGIEEDLTRYGVEPNPGPTITDDAPDNSTSIPSIEHAQLVFIKKCRALGLDDQSAEYLVKLLDPFHDLPLKNFNGVPLVDGSLIVTHTIPSQMTVSKPASGITGTGWDCHLVLWPFINSHNLVQAALLNRASNNATTAATPTAVGSTSLAGLLAGGMCAYPVTRGSDLTTVTTANTTRNVPDALFLNGEYKLIAQAFEVRSVGGMLNRAGSTNLWRQTVPSPESRFTANSVYVNSAGAITQGSGQGTFMKTTFPPGTAAEAKIIGSTVTLSATQGCYIVARPSCIDDSNFCAIDTSYIFLDNTVSTTATVASAPNLAIDPCWMSGPFGSAFTPTNGSAQSINSAQTSSCANFDLCGCQFLGLSDTDTLTIDIKWVIERFPTSADTQLITLAKAPPLMNDNMRRIISQALDEMMVGVEVRMNSFGDFFKGVTSAIGKGLSIVRPIADAVLSKKMVAVMDNASKVLDKVNKTNSAPKQKVEIRQIKNEVDQLRSRARNSKGAKGSAGNAQNSTQNSLAKNSSKIIAKMGGRQSAAL
jgi:hypothetical protein